MDALRRYNQQAREAREPEGGAGAAGPPADAQTTVRAARGG